MFKSARWRNEKNKIKIVFKLQFHATQVTHALGDALIVSVIPADMGRPTMRLEKATVREGCCYWENPVFETVKLLQEPKTGKFTEKIYHFQVLNGSSKTGIIGEVSINFADYIDAIKPRSASLSLKNSNFSPVLHVSIQRMRENIDQMEVDESENENEKVKHEDKSLNSNSNDGDLNGNTHSNYIGDTLCNKPLTNNPEMNGNHRPSSGFDAVSSSESSSDTLREITRMITNNNYQDSNFAPTLNPNLLCQTPFMDDSPIINQENRFSQWDLAISSDHRLNTDESTNISRERSLHSPIVEVEKFKSEPFVYARQAEMVELELQTLRKQIVKESKRGQNFAREVVNLKEERERLKEECERFKASQKFKDEAKQYDGGDLQLLVEELRQELNHEKDRNANLQLQLHKTQESNSELILAVRDLDELLEMNIKDTKLTTEDITRESPEPISMCQTDKDLVQKTSEEIVKEMQIFKSDKDELEMQMEQLALDYEILKQEHHDMSYKLEQSQLQEQLKIQYECSGSFAMMNDLEAQVETLENCLKKQSKELSDFLATIDELETHIDCLEEDLEKQAQQFEADLETLMHTKVEQEQRAILAEEALRTIRLKNVNTAENLQEEFKMLSMQVSSNFDANEKVAMRALTETNALRIEKKHLEEMLRKADQELLLVKEEYEAKISEHSNQLKLKADEVEHLLLEIENQTKHSEEVNMDLSHEMLILREEIEKLKRENSVLLEHEKLKADEVQLLLLEIENQKKHSEETKMDLSHEIEKLKRENSALLEREKEREAMRAELEQMKTSINETDLLLQRMNMEKVEMEETIAFVRSKSDKTAQELSSMRCLKDEKEAIIEKLELQLDTLNTHFNKLKSSLLKYDLEKEKLQNEVFHLKSELSNKEDEFTSIEKKLTNSNEIASKEVESLKERIILLEGEIQLKEATLQACSNSFLEKEKDLQDKIDEVQNRLEELNQSSTIFSEKRNIQKVPVANDTKEITLYSMCEEDHANKIFNTDNGLQMATTKSDETLTDMTSLKQRNLSTEDDLKEMQERYSELSLKFAQVENERQQLAIKVRTLKNARKR